MNAGKSRREFLKEAAFGAVGVAALGGIAGCAPNKQADKSEAATAKERVTTELPIVNNYDFDTPEKTEHTCDVLVIGCGFAGLNAAWCAKQAGADVLVVDKGKPGFSGLSPWPGSHAFFDADMGDNAEQHLEMAKHCVEG